jgi:CHAD domain-containing protein
MRSSVPVGTSHGANQKRMTARSQEYLLPSGTRPEDIKTLLITRCRFIEEPAAVVQRTIFDTFDWSVYLAGGAIEEQVVGQLRRLLWRDLADDGPSLSQEIDREPGFARELPDCPLREKLTSVLGARRLLPLVAVESELQTIRLLNEDDKTVARLFVEENRLVRGGGATDQVLALRLRLVPLKGYDEALAEADKLLSGALAATPAGTPLLHETLAAVGRRPGDYSSKIDYHLDPDGRADAAAKVILLGLLDTLEANIDGVKANIDTEFLHDLRVATRRTRCALTQIRGVFPVHAVDEYKTQFAWVQEVTSTVRDLDVYLLSFENYQRNLPVQLRPHLEPLRAFLLAHYEEHQCAMVRALESPRFLGLLKGWRAFLGAPVPERVVEANAMRPAKDMAGVCIWRLVRRVRREGRSITPASPPEEMHELRKSCKKLRYLMEFFQSLYPEEDIRDLVKQLKVLLDNLGGFQDLSVQARHLMEIARHMGAEGCAGTETLLAMGALVGDIDRQQQRARAAFADLFAAFDARDNRQRFKALFAPVTGASGAT